MKKLLSISLVFLALIALTSPVSAMKKNKSKNFIKIGKTKYKKFQTAPTISQELGEDFVVVLAATKGTGVGTMTLIFNGLKSQITEGAEFDVTVGDSQEGKVFANFSASKSNRKGSTTTAGDEESTVSSGVLKVKSVNEDGNFTGMLKMKVANALVLKQKFNINSIGSITEPTESRKNTSVSAQFTTESLQ